MWCLYDFDWDYNAMIWHVSSLVDYIWCEGPGSPFREWRGILYGKLVVPIWYLNDCEWMNEWMEV